MQQKTNGLRIAYDYISVLSQFRPIAGSLSINVLSFMFCLAVFLSQIIQAPP